MLLPAGDSAVPATVGACPVFSCVVPWFPVSLTVASKCGVITSAQAAPSPRSSLNVAAQSSSFALSGQDGGKFVTAVSAAHPLTARKAKPRAIRVLLNVPLGGSCRFVAWLAKARTLLNGFPPRWFRIGGSAMSVIAPSASAPSPTAGRQDQGLAWNDRRLGMGQARPCDTQAGATSAFDP